MIEATLGARNTDHPAINEWVERMANLCEPDGIFWCSGSEAEKKFLTDEAVRIGILTPLNQEMWPGCYYHRSNPNDVARVEQLTFICTPTEEEAGPKNNWEGASRMNPKSHCFSVGGLEGRTSAVVHFSKVAPGTPT